jgi:hypothetical protein
MPEGSEAPKDRAAVRISADACASVLRCYAMADLDDLHRQFITENRDADWADTMEEHLRAYVAKNAAAALFDVTLLQCRGTLCEIQACSPKDPGGREWNAIANGMRREPWWTFSLVSSASYNLSGESVTLAILRRPTPEFQLH